VAPQQQSIVTLFDDYPAKYIQVRGQASAATNKHMLAENVTCSVLVEIPWPFISTLMTGSTGYNDHKAHSTDTCRLYQARLRRQFQTPTRPDVVHTVTCGGAGTLGRARPIETTTSECCRAPGRGSHAWPTFDTCLSRSIYQRCRRIYIYIYMCVCVYIYVITSLALV